MDSSTSWNMFNTLFNSALCLIASCLFVLSLNLLCTCILAPWSCFVFVLIQHVTKIVRMSDYDAESEQALEARQILFCLLVADCGGGGGSGGV
ncbi:hypothetical protein BpHYR1_027110 [Brachionus plicatilis]|uniref:Uncharacterized protein n=1 Tax=Brachionus plicatilis TaxID=10195 RepID=A0A3M7QWP9_BRAPC|nr:hypothetical protein BpHYR1_027110 [Brachionus plicatilis]